MYLGFRFEQPGCDWNLEQFQECATILLPSRNFQWRCLSIPQKPIFQHPSKATSSLKNVQPNLTQTLKRDIFSDVSCRLCDIWFRVTFAFGKTCFLEEHVQQTLYCYCYLSTHTPTQIEQLRKGVTEFAKIIRKDCFVCTISIRRFQPQLQFLENIFFNFFACMHSHDTS